MASATSELRNFVENELKYPILLKNYLNKSNWKGIDWTKRDWGKLFGDSNHKLPLRFGEIRHKLSSNPQWESTCLKSTMTFKEFMNWEENAEITQTSTCDTKLNSDKYWAYFDYYYMKNLANKDLAEELVSWKDFGFSELKAANSTIWIGTKGANTPCHIDTYGCNIVCQMYGRKRWILFPKEQSKYLYPSRVPYEESSIYSKVGFPYPAMDNFPNTHSTTPYIVTLEPGQCLLVPKHWWHYVENLELSISINVWIDLVSDSVDLLKEAFVMYQVSSISQSITSPAEVAAIFNPNMFDVATMSSSEHLFELIEKVKKYSASLKHGKFDKGNSSIQDSLSFLKPSNIFAVESFSFDYYLKLRSDVISYNTTPEKNSNDQKKNTNCMLFTIIDAITDDRVLDKIVEVLEEKLNV